MDAIQEVFRPPQQFIEEWKVRALGEVKSRDEHERRAWPPSSAGRRGGPMPSCEANGGAFSG